MAHSPPPPHFSENEASAQTLGSLTFSDFTSLSSQLNGLQPGETGNIYFVQGLGTDKVTFPDYTIVISLQSTSAAPFVSFNAEDGTYNAERTVFTTTIQPVRFTVLEGGSTGTSFGGNYRINDSSGGTMSRQAAVVFVANTGPTTNDNAVLPTERGAAGTILFSTFVSDSVDDFGALSVYISTVSNADSPVTITDLVTFDSGHVTVHTGNNTATINESTVGYTVAADAAHGQHAFNYTAVDSSGASSVGVITLNIPTGPLGEGLKTVTALKITSSENTQDSTKEQRLGRFGVFNNQTAVSNDELREITYTINNNGMSTTPGSSNTLEFISTNQFGLVGTLRITINDPSFFGTDMFTWTLSHPDGRASTGAINVAVAREQPSGPIPGDLKNLVLNITSSEASLTITTSDVRGLVNASLNNVNDFDVSSFNVPTSLLNGALRDRGFLEFTGDDPKVFTYASRLQDINATYTTPYVLTDNVNNLRSSGTIILNVMNPEFPAGIGDLGPYQIQADQRPVIIANITNAELITALRYTGNGINTNANVDNFRFTVVGGNQDVGPQGGTLFTTAGKAAGLDVVTYTYTPSPSFLQGTETFEYIASDIFTAENVRRSIANISFEVLSPFFPTPIDDFTINIPYVDLMFGVLHEVPLNRTTIQDLVNAADNNIADDQIDSLILVVGDTNTSTSGQIGSRGSSAAVAGSTFRIIPSSDFINKGGSETFTLFITNPATGLYGNSTLTVTTPLQANPPTTPDITVAEVQQGDSGNIPFSSVTDSIDNFGVLTIVLNATSTSNNPQADITDLLTFTDAGQATINDNGMVTITAPNADFTLANNAVAGTYTFDYNVTNSNGLSSVGTITLTVTERTNPPPTATNISSGAVSQGASSLINFAAVVTVDQAATFANVTITSRSNDNDISITELLTFTPSDDFTTNDDASITITSPTISFTINDGVQAGTYVFNYIATDSTGAESSSTTITFSVDAVSMCTSEIAENFDLGQIGIGSISKVGTMVVNNTGSQNIIQLEIRADDWMQDDGVTPVINAGQTHYSLAKADPYNNGRTPFTGTLTDLGQGISLDDIDGLPVYVQVLPVLINGPDSYRGQITQMITVSPTCAQ